MKIIQRIERLEDEWGNENVPEHYWVIVEEGKSVDDGSWYDTEEEASNAYADLPEEERYP